MTLSLSPLVQSLALLLLIVLQGPWSVGGKLRPIKPGCRYEGRRYQEGMPVRTSEPCLQCRCIEGALRCRLRICPRMPSPPPPGCRVRPPVDNNTCCADVVCAVPHEMEKVLRRANVDIEERVQDDEVDVDADTDIDNMHIDGCLHEGVRYGPGSAMISSRRCEYCYCISGVRRCIRPKCLLPLPGCIPFYAPYSCCPVSYNCTQLHSPIALPLLRNESLGDCDSGCRVDGRVYEEGEMVRDIKWKAACDNCFCAMGAIRCVPLACAPPLQGCSPIVRHGHCCPSTYNCSGSIEVKATQQNYASYAFISKDYAKLRKETSLFPAIEHSTSLPVEGRGHRVVNDHIDASTIDTAEGFSTDIDVESTSTLSTFETGIMDNEILPETATTLTLDQEITTDAFESPKFEWTSTSEETNTETESTMTDFTKIFTDSTADTTIFVEEMTISFLGQLCEDNSKDSHRQELNKGDDKVYLSGSSKILPTTAATGLSLEGKDEGLESINATDGAALSPAAEANVKGRVTGPSSTIVIPDDMLVMNVTVKTNVSVDHIPGVTINPIRSIPPDVEAILNITHRQKDDDYDYDYSEPTLPPSLPNVRIIPFVAADALVKNKDVPSAVTKYPSYPSGSVIVPAELRPTESPVFYDVVSQGNRFSPPVETEGGFVPREPSYFNTPYHSTDLNLEIGTAVTILPGPIVQPQRKDDDLPSNCLLESREYRHGDILPNTSDICTICMCYYGEVVCTPEKCPPLRIGCRRITVEGKCCGKIVCVDAEDSPTVVLDRADATLPSESQPIVSSDPFRDVIKTEPAPDLPSLIEDMFPHLVEHSMTTAGLTTKTTTTTMPTSPITASTRKKLATSIRLHFPQGVTTYIGGPSTEAMEHEESRPQKAALKKPLPLTYNSMGPNSITIGTTDKSEDHVHVLDPENMEYTTEGTYPSSNPANTTDQSYPTKTKGMHNSSELQAYRQSETTAVFQMEPVWSNNSDVSNSTENDHNESIFSLESVFDLFFSDANDKTMLVGNESSATTVKAEVTGLELLGESGKISTGSDRLTNNVETTDSSSKMTVNEIPTSTGGLLKLAGCNIYGRMYRVGRIITELSGPCLECRCTEIGVQCKQLEC